MNFIIGTSFGALARQFEKLTRLRDVDTLASKNKMVPRFYQIGTRERGHIDHDGTYARMTRDLQNFNFCMSDLVPF